MGWLRKTLKKWIESASDSDVERFEGRSFAVTDRRRRFDAWFSYRSQLEWLLERFRVDLVLDVGANTGQFAKRLRLFYLGAILSFEPIPDVYAELASATKDDPKWRAVKMALGSQPSTKVIHVASESVFSSFLDPNTYLATHFGRGEHRWHDEAVQVRRLEDVLDEMYPEKQGRRIFLKIDTQGFDVEVFKGLGHRLDDVVAIQTEVSLIPIYDGMPHWTETIALFESAGFAVAGLFPVNREKDTGRVIEYDCLMVRGPAMQGRGWLESPSPA